jgi:alkylation response protein AidB-like acyl-CoA dehydrogenase
MSFTALFDRIAAGAVARERDRVLPFEPIAWLKEAGFTALRVPAALGGGGADLPELFARLTELAAADPNVAQALRGHFAFAEDRLHAGDEAWLRRIAAGALVGNAVTEVGDVALGDTRTRLTPREDGDGWTISGSKHYTTGSIFADWIDATALTPDGAEVAALVPADAGGVTVTDDWAGFGQQLTGSGTAVFDAAPVAAEHVYAFAARFPYQTAFYQQSLNAVLAGIARAAHRDLVAHLARRDRSYSHGNTPRTRDDPQVLELAGRLGASAFAAEAAVEKAARVLARTAAGAAPLRDGELASIDAQLVAADAALANGSLLFDALGASATDARHGLDRHWRNARTVRSHNPIAFKARIAGDAQVNDAEPPYEWSVGTTTPTPTTGATARATLA